MKNTRRDGRWSDSICEKSSGRGALLCANRKGGTNVDSANTVGEGDLAHNSQATLPSGERQLLSEREAVPRGPSVRVNWIIHWH